MSVRTVTYYQLECDEPGCGTTTSELGDYSAWADHGAAIEEWFDNDGVELEDGRTFCVGHGEKHRCAECREPSNALVVGEDEVRRCAHCHKETLAEQEAAR